LCRIGNPWEREKVGKHAPPPKKKDKTVTKAKETVKVAG